MNHHAWASKQLIVLVAMSLAFLSAANAAESSRFHPDGKTGIERVPAPPAASDLNPGAQEAAGQTSPRPSPATALPPTVKAPQVSYEDGQLTVIAENSLLSDVMKALRQALGADIDLPASVVDQHIWVHLGPGPASRVLRDLLDSTEFNYVIQASESDPDGIRSVLLTARSKSTGAETVPSGKTGIRWMPGHGPDAQRSMDSENPAPEPPVASVDPSQAPAPVASGDPSQAPAPMPPASASTASLQNAPENSGSGALGAPPATVAEQQIQQLQSMYQQRKLIQMQHNQKAAGQNQ